jgi:acyl-CoA synthetase (AMP-forming)/AMP-acid ligase II
MQDTDIVNVVISAYIVSDEFIDIMKLKQFCLSQMEPYKVPHHFEIIKSIPRTPTGKIKRNQLKEELGYGNKAESL